MTCHHKAPALLLYAHPALPSSPSLQAFAEVDAHKDELLRSAAAGELEAGHAERGEGVAAAAGSQDAPAAGGSGDGGSGDDGQPGQPSFSLFETARESLGAAGGTAPSPAAAAPAASGAGEPQEQERSPDAASRRALACRTAPACLHSAFALQLACAAWVAC